MKLPLAVTVKLTFKVHLIVIPRHRIAQLHASRTLFMETLSQVLHVFFLTSMYVSKCLCLHLERVGDHNCNEPNRGADALGRPRGPASMERTGRVDDGEVPIYADTDRGGRERGASTKPFFFFFLPRMLGLI